MRFTESKRRVPWFVITLLVIVVAVSVLSFCEFQPTQKTVQKTIVFEAD